MAYKIETVKPCDYSSLTNKAVIRWVFPFTLVGLSYTKNTAITIADKEKRLHAQGA